MKLEAYPKIFALGTKYIQNILDDEVVISEKIDGSQFVFGKIDNELRARSKGKELVLSNPENMFQKAVDYVLSIESLIPNNTIYYCEYLQKEKHNSLQYKKVPTNNLMLFAVQDVHGWWFDEDTLLIEANSIRIDPIPTLYKGKSSVDHIKELLSTPSALGSEYIEGVVVKRNKEFFVGDVVLPVMSGKYVSEKFKEVHKETWSKEHTSRGKWEDFKECFRTEARWNKAIQHLKESGKLEETPKDIGKLIKEVHKDIVEEEKECIMEYLFKEFGKDLLRNSTRGLPEWYKTKLLENTND